MSSDKTLILVRHAHRNKFLGQHSDNGLSLKGKLQARKLSKYFAKILKNKDVSIYSSPKKRCVQTVKPLAKLLSERLYILSYLSEGKPLSKKVTKFNKLWKSDKSEIIIACSHGDWIPYELGRLIKKAIELKKGGAAILVKTNSRIRLKKVIQKF